MTGDSVATQPLRYLRSSRRTHYPSLSSGSSLSEQVGGDYGTITDFTEYEGSALASNPPYGPKSPDYDSGSWYGTVQPSAPAATLPSGIVSVRRLDMAANLTRLQENLLGVLEQVSRSAQPEPLDFVGAWLSGATNLRQAADYLRSALELLHLGTRLYEPTLLSNWMGGDKTHELMVSIRPLQPTRQPDREVSTEPELDWIEQHWENVAKYAGQWLAIVATGIVGHGETMLQAKELATRAGHLDPVMYFVPDQNDLGIPLAM